MLSSVLNLWPYRPANSLSLSQGLLITKYAVLVNNSRESSTLGSGNEANLVMASVLPIILAEPCASIFLCHKYHRTYPRTI